MKHADDALVDRVAVYWDGSGGSFLTRTEPLESDDEQVVRILRAFPMIRVWEDAFLMANCAARRMNCGMDLRAFSFDRGEPIVRIRDGGDEEISLGESAFYRLLVRMFRVMISAVQLHRLTIIEDKAWLGFVQDVAALAER